MRKGHGPDRDLYDHRLDAQYEKLWQDTAAHAASLVIYTSTESRRGEQRPATRFR